jgi:anti-sigma-K factor RskA
MEQDGHERFEDELAAYMLGSLEPAETSAFEQHLAGCERCQARERWLRASIEVLPSSVEQIEPPPALRERLLETVRSEAGSVPAPTQGRRRKRDRPSIHRRGPGLRAAFWSVFQRPATAVAAVALLIGVGAGGYAIGQGGGGPEKKTIAVTGTTAKGTLERTGDSAVLRVSNLPQQRDRVYEVWLLQDGKPVPSALFEVSPNGTGSAGIPHGLDRSTQVMVTSEPSEGSTKPTSTPVLSAPV